jgi:hypothetical protein
VENTNAMKKSSLFLLLIIISLFNLNAQIVIDNTAPYDNPTWLVDNVLLGGGITTSNHAYQGDSAQIGWFNAVNTNLGINSGIVLCTGDVYALDPVNGGGFPFIANTVTDPDLLAVANSVPGMIGQTFTVSSINDVAVLEFDFIPTSDSLKFKYAFGSQEYFGFENTQYNDVFGFFLSGPGIVGPWSSPPAFLNGSVNLAIVPGTNPPLPITISSINSVTPINQQYFVPNQGTGLDTIADADGFTTVLTARALVQCGETYHIKLAIADGTDGGLSSYVWLEGGSFFSPSLSISDDLGIDSTYMNIACRPDITLTASGGNGVAYQWIDQNGNIIGTDSSVVVGVGAYVVSASSAGCSLYSDTLRVISVSDSLPPTALNCVWERNGDMYFDWDHPQGASSTTVYSIMGSENLGGPYSSVVEVDFPNDIYAHPLSSIPSNTQFYYITTASTCAQGIISSDTLSAIAFDISHANVNCWDDKDGRIAIDFHSTQLVSFTYSLDGVSNPNAWPLDSVWENLPAGTYNVTISDNANCVIEEEISITAPGFVLQALVSGDMSVCYGDNLGFAVGFGSGGTPGYSYEWFDDTYTSFSLNDTAFGLSSGSYYLEVMDANGCDTFTSVQVISPQTSLSGSPQLFGVVCKGDSTGMLVGDAQGSWAPYQYYWMSSLGDTLQDSGVRLTRDTLFGLSVGSYDLHVYDAKGCFVSYSMSVGEPATKLRIDSMAVIESIACYGDSVGEARLYASGGMPNYEYAWSDGQSTLLVDGLTSGYHSVVLSDAWGCEVLDSIYVPENSKVESVISTIQNSSCYGFSDGEVWVTSTGGVPSYTYYWSNGHTGFSMPDTASGLLHGSYYVTTQDILGCEVVDSVSISEPDPLSMEASELDWIDCYGADNGLAGATAIGGTMPYVFNWYDSAGILIATGDTINTLAPGLHTVVVTDAKGCSASDTVFTHEPAELVIVIDDAQTVLAYCIGVNTASLTGIASGGTPGYTYEWNDNTVNPQTTATATALLAGVYTITVTDTKGCIAIDIRDIDTLTSTMDADTSSLIQYIGGNDVSCFGENDAEAMVTAWGGHAPYVYQWYGPNGFNANTAVIGNLVAGTYSVTIRDTNNCMVNTSIVLSQPDYIYFTTLGYEDEACLGACNGEIAIDITGGVGPYSGVATENTTGNVLTSLMANDSVVPGVCSGNYTITITDVNACPSSVINGGVNQQTIGTSDTTIATIDPAAITNVLCNGTATGSLQALSPSTNPNYSYSWQNTNNTGFVISNTTIATNLIAGTYVLYAHYSDANNLGQNYSGCTVTDTVSVTELAALESVVSVTDVSCYGNATGKLVASATSGGTSSYNLQWNPGGVTGSVFNNLTAGTYTLTITDFNSCQAISSFTVTEPQALVSNITKSGYVLTATLPVGGTAPFSYSWREQLNSATQIGTGNTYTVTNYGDYYVLVTDANGCESESNSFEYVEIINAVGEASSLLELSIYPNPFKEETTIAFGREIQAATVRVVDVFGKVIEEHTVTNTNKHILKRGNKASAIYFVEIEVGEVTLFHKIIIE